MTSTGRWGHPSGRVHRGGHPERDAEGECPDDHPNAAEDGQFGENDPSTIRFGEERRDDRAVSILAGGSEDA
jgi:hypothetical protein